MRDLLVLAGNGGMVINEELREILSGRARYADTEGLGQCLDAIRRGTYENINHAMPFIELLIRLKQA